VGWLVYDDGDAFTAYLNGQFLTRLGVEFLVR
jgi:hypothetical protein